MIRPEIAEAVATVSSELLFDSCSPNKTLLEKALSFDVDTLETLTDTELSKFIVVLGQYLVTLKYKENEILVRKVELGKHVDRLSLLDIQSRPWKAGVTLKEKVALVTQDNKVLISLCLEKDKTDSEYAIVDGMYNAFSEYLNTYKKEQSRRIGSNSFDGVR